MYKEVIVELSKNCNLACIMCGFGQEENKREKFMSFSLFKKIIDNVADKTEIIRLNGRGESTLHPNFCKMIDYINCNNPGVHLSLFSNLSYRKPRIIETLIKNDIRLFVSIDSPHPDELENIRIGANFNTIIDNLDKLKTMKSRPFIVFTMQEKNLHQLVNIAHFSLKKECSIIYNVVRRDKGIEEFQYMIKNNLRQIKSDFTDIKKLYSDSELKCFLPSQVSGINLQTENTSLTYGELNKCPALKNELCFQYNGDVTPCNMFNPFIYGNINESSLDKILTSKKKKLFEKTYKEHYYCLNCSCLGV